MRRDRRSVLPKCRVTMTRPASVGGIHKRENHSTHAEICGVNFIDVCITLRVIYHFQTREARNISTTKPRKSLDMKSCLIKSMRSNYGRKKLSLKGGTGAGRVRCCSNGLLIKELLVVSDIKEPSFPFLPATSINLMGFLVVKEAEWVGKEAKRKCYEPKPHSKHETRRIKEICR